jgi:subfamily B ATP-binding cassette protein MsbA
VEAGATLAVVFLAVEELSAADSAPFSSPSNPLLSWTPGIASWLHSLPSTALFVGLLALAVLLQALQSLTRYLNQVSVGYFAARCNALVTARIHSQVLICSFPCASGTKVGDLTNHASQVPEAIRIQSEQSGQLLMGAALSDWREPELASPEPPGTPARTNPSRRSSTP